MSNQTLSQTLLAIFERTRRGEAEIAESMKEVDGAIFASPGGSYQERERLRMDAHQILTGYAMAREAGDPVPTAERIDYLRRSAEELEAR